MRAARDALDPESTLGRALDAGARTTDHQPNTVKPVPTKKHNPGATRPEARPGASGDRGDDLATRGVADAAPWPNVWTWHAPGEGRDAAIDVAMRTEWLLTNGLGGFAMGSVPDVPTRRYHGLLIAAASPPVGRTLALHSLVATLHVVRDFGPRFAPGARVLYLGDTADKHGIPYQLKTHLGGGTDAGAIHTTTVGVMSGVISVPCRYIHSPTAYLNRDDYANTVRLVQAVLNDIKWETVRL